MRNLLTILLCLFTWTAFGQWTNTLNKDRRYNEISWLVNHNAYNNPEIGAYDGNPGGINQWHSINQQLQNGVRSFMVDLQHQTAWNRWSSSFVLGHGIATNLYYMDWCDFLSKIKIFLDNNPNEIITLHIEVSDKVTHMPQELYNSFKGRGQCTNDNANVYPYIYKESTSSGAPEDYFAWKSLNYMIATNQRLVIFTEKKVEETDLVGNYTHYPWIRPEFEWTRQNDYKAAQVYNLTESHRYQLNGNGGRGNVAAQKLTINNFCTDEPGIIFTGDINKSREANEYNRMHTKMLRSWFSFGKRPSAAVDFYEQNDYSAMRVMNDLNTYNEVAGSFYLEGAGLVPAYVSVGSSIEGANWKMHGAPVMARGHFSYPARSGESRVITFWHPDYEFSPSSINLGDYDGANKETFRINITVSPKSSNTPIGQVISLRAMANGKFVAKQSDNHLKANATTYNSTNTHFMIVDAGGGYVALRNMENERYTIASNQGVMKADRTAIGDWEKLKWIRNSDGTISLQAKSNNKYVAAENAGNSNLIANRTAIGAWEKFYTYKISDDIGIPFGQTIALKAKANNKFVRVEPGELLRPIMINISDDETKFVILPGIGDNVVLKSVATGKYLAVSFDILVANKSNVTTWGEYFLNPNSATEQFQWIRNNDGTISLKSVTNHRYVVAEAAGNDILRVNRIGIGTWEKFYVSELGSLMPDGATTFNSTAEETTTSATKNSLTIVGNPVVNGNLRINYELGTTSSTYLALFDQQGRLVKEWSKDLLADGYHELEESLTVPTGIYFLRAQFGNQQITKRVVFQK